MFCCCYELKVPQFQTETILIKKELLRFLYVSFAETTCSKLVFYFPLIHSSREFWRRTKHSRESLEPKKYIKIWAILRYSQQWLKIVSHESKVQKISWICFKLWIWRFAVTGDPLFWMKNWEKTVLKDIIWIS